MIRTSIRTRSCREAGINCSLYGRSLELKWPVQVRSIKNGTSSRDDGRGLPNGFRLQRRTRLSGDNQSGREEPISAQFAAPRIRKKSHHKSRIRRGQHEPPHFLIGSTFQFAQKKNPSRQIGVFISPVECANRCQIPSVALGVGVE
jgi:hypothetical protein